MTRFGVSRKLSLSCVVFVNVNQVHSTACSDTMCRQCVQMYESVAQVALVLTSELVYERGWCAVERESYAASYSHTHDDACVVFVMKKIRTTRIELVTNRFPSDTDTQNLHTTVERSTNSATLGHNHIQTHTQSTTQTTTNTHTTHAQDTLHTSRHHMYTHNTHSHTHARFPVSRRTRDGSRVK